MSNHIASCVSAMCHLWLKHLRTILGRLHASAWYDQTGLDVQSSMNAGMSREVCRDSSAVHTMQAASAFHLNSMFVALVGPVHRGQLAHPRLRHALWRRRAHLGHRAPPEEGRGAAHAVDPRLRRGRPRPEHLRLVALPHRRPPRCVQPQFISAETNTPLGRAWRLCKGYFAIMDPGPAHPVDQGPQCCRPRQPYHVMKAFSSSISMKLLCVRNGSYLRLSVKPSRS